MEANITTDISGGVPLFAKVTLSASLTLSVSGTYQSENSQTAEESFSFPIQCYIT